MRFRGKTRSRHRLVDAKKSGRESPVMRRATVIHPTGHPTRTGHRAFGTKKEAGERNRSPTSGAVVGCLTGALRLTTRAL